jgi:hypothetical protein
MNRNKPCQYLISISCLYYLDRHNRHSHSRISDLLDPAALLGPSEFSPIARRGLTPASLHATSHLQNRVTLTLRGRTSASPQDRRYSVFRLGKVHPTLPNQRLMPPIRYHALPDLRSLETMYHRQSCSYVSRNPPLVARYYARDLVFL